MTDKMKDMMMHCEKAPMERDELMRRIQEVSFYAVDLNLYIDNFPENEQAVRDYQAISRALNNLHDIYEKYYGPLKNFGDSVLHGEWSYINDPWPWERQGR